MGVTRGQIKNDIYLRLNKSATTRGFYTDDKANSVVQESLDYLTTEMMLEDEGFVHKLDYVTVPANCVTVPMRAHWAMINEVRYLNGNTYAPLGYDQKFGAATWSEASGVVQSPSTYSIIDNMFYFTPAIGVGGTDYLQVEYMAYPPAIRKDGDVLGAQFDRCMYWFTVYHSCVLLTGQVQQSGTDWPTQRDVWYARAKDLISMRTRECVPIRDFAGY